MKGHTQKIFCLLFGICLVLAMFPISVAADTGPKPSVCFRFENLGDEICYATMLSKEESTGPLSAWEGEVNAERLEDAVGWLDRDFDLDVLRAFVGYEDPDGYYFMPYVTQVQETKSFSWTYFPPDSFKILLYFPATDNFAVSGICERYAFDSYYTVDMEEATPAAEEGGTLCLWAVRSYDYQHELQGLVARILITVAVEMVVAILFCFAGKRSFGFLIAVNALTQIVMNVWLNIVKYQSGEMAFMIEYIMLEFAVFVVEAILYCIFRKRLGRRPKSVFACILYSLFANAVSFAVGVYLPNYLPGLF